MNKQEKQIMICRDAETCGLKINEHCGKHEKNLFCCCGCNEENDGNVCVPYIPEKSEPAQQELLTDEEINTAEMPCDEDIRSCPINPTHSYDATSVECQLCSHRLTAQAQHLKTASLYQAKITALQTVIDHLLIDNSVLEQGMADKEKEINKLKGQINNFKEVKDE